MDKNKIKDIASSLLFEVSDEVLVDLDEFFSEHQENLQKLKKIDTTGIEPMFFVDPSPKNFLREDVQGEVISKEALLANCKEVFQDYVALPKAVKNEE